MIDFSSLFDGGDSSSLDSYDWGDTSSLLDDAVWGGSTNDFSLAPSLDDLMDSIGNTFDGGASGGDWFFGDPFVQQTFSDMFSGGYSGSLNIPNILSGQAGAGFGSGKTVEALKPDDGGGLIGKISKFVNKNKGLSEMLAKGVAGAAIGASNVKAAKAASQSRMDELKLKDEQERRKNEEYSASVSGLRAPVPFIRQPKLKRVGGAPVFSNGAIPRR